MRRIVPAIVLLLCIIATGAYLLFTRERETDLILTVNGTPLTRRDLAARQRWMASYPQSSSRSVSASRFTASVQGWVAETLLRQLAEREHVTPTDRQMRGVMICFRAGLMTQRDFCHLTEGDVRTALFLQQCAINLFAKEAAITDSDVKNRYDEQIHNQSSVFHPAACHIAVIICASSRGIDKAYRQLQGGRDFGSVAQELSEDKATAAHKGQVGWLAMGMPQVPLVVRRTAFSTAIGDHCEPFFVRDNNDQAWMILMVDQKRRAKCESFDDVREAIRLNLAMSRADRKVFDAMVSRFVSNADIEVKDQRVKDVLPTIRAQARTGEVFSSYLP